MQVRYHHDGKYNVMSLDGPIEIYGQFAYYVYFLNFLKTYYSRCTGISRLPVNPLVPHSHCDTLP